ncbi:efflux RND transporter periplasmic adaptor subunit [Pinisolibacter aquiterrae]|uniref:efflux RND transporter periplasmic adaptor subunit n=1 Tax=Pinisolibacter aquiterrae TaxID=2815579 RepID=UPI001C3DB559|nr:HlyD family efflux transporter periplasmic adaptor subunit [Pinisolibacter aquiterrae]MBV5263891.1 efflux RND transporter periplasmic adaptor subunit [Pinisolibacter aquiterrae]MCC8234588.1 efflux RND transporter periplasmic adaptor subunit [Pinisolibacter aquiterrae]
MHRSLAFASFALALALLAAPAARAHDGHDHGAPPPPISTTVAPRADASSDDLEMVVVARAGALEILIDHFRDNQPVTDAIVEVDGPAGLVKATAEGGVYRLPAPWAEPGRTIDLAVTVQAGDIVDVLTTTLTLPPVAAKPAAGSVVMPARASDGGPAGVGDVLGGWGLALAGFAAGLAFAGAFGRRRIATAALAGLFLLGIAPGSPVEADEARDLAQRLPDGTLFVPKSSQRILGLRTLFTEIADHPTTVELPGRVIPDPDGSGVVQSSLAGRLKPPPGGFPRLGTTVAAGDVLAYVEPAVAAADVTTQHQQARELDQQIALMTQRLERYRQITNSIARAQIEDTEVELTGLKARRANLEKRERASEALVAPVSGVVAALAATTGQIAEPNTVVFRIVDPRRFWVEALAYEAHVFAARATGRPSGGESFPLTFVGSGLSDRAQAVPVHFAVDGEAKGLRAGQLLTVSARLSETRGGIAVPRSAVLRGSNGRSLVWEHTNPERFVPREVRVEPLDGERVLIVAGVEAGRRIVTGGAELLNQIR